MKENVCSVCGSTIPEGEKKCLNCGQVLPAAKKFDLLVWLNQLPLAGKIALAGLIIFIPSFLFSWGATPMIWGAVLLGIAFLMFIIKIGV